MLIIRVEISTILGRNTGDRRLMKKIEIKTNCKKMLSDIYTPVGIYLRLRDRFRDTILLHQSIRKLQHVGRHVHACHAIRSAFGEFGDEPAGAAADIADGLAANIAALVHHPVESLVNVLAEMFVHEAAQRTLVGAGVNGIELGGDRIPESGNLRHIVLLHLETVSLNENAGAEASSPLSRKLEN